MMDSSNTKRELSTMTDLHDDDKPVGRLLTRREVLILLGGSGAALAAGLTLPTLLNAQGTATPAPRVTATSTVTHSASAGGATPTAAPLCVVRPELSEGPFFIDQQLMRMDVRIDPSNDTIADGTPLRLVYRVVDVTGGVCQPLEGAQVDIWHCDAAGEYSGVEARNIANTDQLWLRGAQVTGADGRAEFVTIVPGWYPGRAVHIHFKIRVQNQAEQTYEFTSQLFFDPQQIEQAYAAPAYRARGLPNTANDRDGIYRASEDLLTLDLQPLTTDELEALKLNEITLADGYSATFDIGLDLADARTGAADGF
jgi:protocatechuate 3,4-dioxygenase beta subunit